MRWGCLLLLAGIAGCGVFDKARHYVGRADLDYYTDAATTIDYPDVESSTEALGGPPRTLRHPRKDTVRDVPLAEAIQTALSNSRVLKDNIQFLSTSNPLLTSPNQVRTAFDPALQESGVLFGRRGVEAALADFDTRFTTTMTWGRNETIQNNRFLSGGLTPGSTLAEETGAFTSRLEKQMATGGILSLSHNWNYSLNNVPSRLFGSSYTGFLRADYRQPLLAGAGTEFNRIAGPLGSNLSGVSGVNQGVVIARINNDISLADFEASVRNLVRDVESVYWQLALNYHVYHSETVARDSALQTWREVRARGAQGLSGGSAADEAQARDNYFERRARTENALADLNETEGRLRRLIGLPVNDGSVLRPSDEPSAAEFSADWEVSLAEALTRRVELRRQKWNIKSLELQLRAAKNLVRPRLDLVGGYQVNGFGDTLISRSDNDGVTSQGLHSGYGTLTQGDQTGWNLGVEFSMPLGFRRAHAQVRNIELSLARARAVLSTQELEISHELSQAFQELDRWYQTTETNFNRRQAAAARVNAFTIDYRAGRAPLDLLLRSQISLAQAEIEYYRSLIQYNVALADLQFRKGTLLDHDNIALAEGPWNSKAYSQALQRAWARSHAIGNRLLHSEPEEFVLPASSDEEGTPEFDEEPFDGEPADVVPPAPAPTTAPSERENSRTNRADSPPISLPETASVSDTTPASDAATPPPGEADSEASSNVGVSRLWDLTVDRDNSPALPTRASPSTTAD